MFTIIVLKGEGNLTYTCSTEKEARFAGELFSNPGWTVMISTGGSPATDGKLFASYFNGEEYK